MTCNPINFVPYSDTQVIRIEDITEAVAGSITNGVKLPRTGSSKVYKQSVQVYNSGKTELYFYMPALYKKKKAYQKVIRTTNKLVPPTKCDETTTVATDTVTENAETVLEEFPDDDSVFMKACFISVNCKTHVETPFAAADISISGYSDGGFIYKYTIDWDEFLSFAGCIREYPLEVTDPSTPVYLNVSRVSQGADFGSKHDVYFIGYKNIEDKQVWTKPVAGSEKITNQTPTGLSTPAFTKPSLSKISSASDIPNITPSGGTFVSSLCLGSVPEEPTRPGLSIDDISTDESATPATFTVTCNPPAESAFTVQYQTQDGTAISGTDYLATSGTLSFAIGDSTKTIDVAIINDVMAESPESFSVRLSNVSNPAITVTKAVGNCNVIDDDTVAGTGSCPILVIGKPSFQLYKPGVEATFPPVVGQIPSADTNMEIKLTVQNTQGAITPPVGIGGATVSYDSATKTLTVSGPKNDVNATVSSIKFTPAATDSGDISISGQLTNLTTPGTGQSSGKFVTENPFFPARSAEAPNIEVTGSSGSIVLRVIDTSNNTLVTDLYTVPVSFTSNLDATADLIVYAINNSNSSPKFTAEKTALNSFKVIAPSGLGSKANNYQVVPKERTGSLNIGGSSAFVNGVTGSGDNKKKNSNIGDWLANAGKALLATAIDGVANELLIPRDEDTAVEDIRYYYQGCVVVPVPVNYNEVTRTMDGAWDYETFKLVFTDNPAWCALHHIQDTAWGLGSQIYALMDRDQKIQLHQDLYEVSLRCDEMIGGLPRYTINAALTNKRNRKDQLADICSVFHGRPIWDSRNTLRIFQDRPKAPKMIVNHTSVTDEGFEYAGGSYNNVSKCLVSWFDPRNHSALATTGVGLSVGGVVNDQDTVSVVGYGIADEAQAIRHGRKVLVDNEINPVAVRYTSLADHSNLIPGDVVRILDVWTDTDWPNAQAGRCWPNAVSGSTVTDIKIDQPYKSEYSGKNIYIEKDDGTVLESTITGGSGNIITLADSITTTDISGLNKYNIGDGQLLLLTEITPKRFDTGMYEVAGIYYDASKFTKIDTGI